MVSLDRGSVTRSNYRMVQQPSTRRKVPARTRLLQVIDPRSGGAAWPRCSVSGSGTWQGVRVFVIATHLSRVLRDAIPRYGRLQVCATTRRIRSCAPIQIRPRSRSAQVAPTLGIALRAPVRCNAGHARSTPERPCTPRSVGNRTGRGAPCSLPDRSCN